ncbi:MAG TPA: cofactor-independent phosphoglycerate mutase [Syntrophales bacterium]|nr:cofactor-independent phosphoglycerate mutase [Syntrophales bacterium]HPI55919.1 cofactor-independent phosphoglycerate mutase [Syntrophales bacterium]HPN23590.1 cofactor-independent phosphoglycerate mutase [Syntrophales bacterium]HQM27885.1 cofactor-independent phosphoglycerate mutase [Syntrophales bacterium]
MKYVILLGDGMADHPIEELGGKTPLEYARTPNMDRLSRLGTTGLVETIPAGFPPGSDVANLTVLGYDPKIYYTGRGPLEAASMGIKLEPGDVAFRCNLVNLGLDGKERMVDFTAGHITSEEARSVITDLNEALGSEIIRFYPGVGYRHLCVWKGGPASVKTTPPHDITGQEIAGYLPAGDGSAAVWDLMMKSRGVLKEHPVNRGRAGQGKKTANSIWLWGQGGAPTFDTLTVKYGIQGAMISAVDLLNGIAVCAGMEIIRVPGVTGYIDTNYAGKAMGALSALKEKDLAFVHVEAPDEMGHAGNIEGKVKAIEDFDEKVVGTVLGGIDAHRDFRILVLSDHPTPVNHRTHVAEPSPFVVYSSVKEENLQNCPTFGETCAKRGGVMVAPGHALMDVFIREWRGFVDSKRRR